MAFFEQIGKRISDASQGATQQAKNFAEITRLNGMISDKKHQIQQLYTAIGQKYCQLHQAEESAEFSQEMQKITLLLSEIKQHQTVIQQIRGVAVCPCCGAEIPANAQFCSSCGTSIQKLVALSGKVCPQCGRSAERTGAFCIFCGAKLDAAPLSQAAAPQRICPSCHTVLASDNAFCPECGAPCNAEPNAASPSQAPTDIPEQPAAAAPQRICPNCHTVLAPDDIFCPECGAMLENT